MLTVIFLCQSPEHIPTCGMVIGKV